MWKATAHPKKVQLCAFCKRWDGDANLKFKSPLVGFEYTTGVFGRCMVHNGLRPSTSSVRCPHYTPSVEAEKLL